MDREDNGFVGGLGKGVRVFTISKDENASKPTKVGKARSKWFKWFCHTSDIFFAFHLHAVDQGPYLM